MTSYVFDPKDGKLVPSALYYAKKYGEVAAKMSNLPMPYVRGDLPAYKSPVTGKVIEGRAARREDLARSGCREVDPSEYKPNYRNYEFCQRNRLPYMGADVPPPMTKDERAWSKEKRRKFKEAEAAAMSGPDKTDPELAKFVRGNTKDAPIFKNSTVKD
jgi:hypothetical protein